SIGFIQPHKGFDRAVRAFAANGLGARGCRLDVVGSVRLEEPDFLAHLSELERLAESTPGVRLHTTYVSDEAFDRWIVASDVLVLPYRHIWSSGVLERAALYDRPVIITRVGGLEAQAAGRASVLKAVVRRLTAWQVDPIVHQLNRLQQAVVEATERLDSARNGEIETNH